MNIKSNEIRVGNWVQDVGSQPFQIMPNDILALYQTEIAGKIHIGINPIPLTEEILLKAGFEKFMGVFHLNIDNPMSFHYGFINSLGCLSMDIGGEEQNLDHIKHLHQLQNLYYSLTGTELEIKLA